MAEVREKRHAYEWDPPEGPHDYGVGRECYAGKKCETRRLLAISGQKPEVGKVVRYAEPYSGGILLCDPCNRKRVVEGKTPRAFLGRSEPKREPGLKLKNLEYYKNLRGLTTKELALRANCSTEQCGAAQRRAKNISVVLAQAFADVLGVTVEDLREDNGT